MRPVLSSLRRMNRLQVREVKRALDPYNYIGVMHLIVLYIRKNPGASQEEIACFFGLDKASVARDARRLEEMGHIARRVNDAGGRGVRAGARRHRRRLRAAHLRRVLV